jgi:hypothetical protein
MTENRTELEQLRSEVAELRLALEAESAERAALPKLLVPAAAEAKRDVATLEENFSLTMQAVDARITGLAKRVANSGDSELREAIVELLPEIMQGTIKLVHQAVEQAELRMMERIATQGTLIGKVVELQVKQADYVDHILDGLLKVLDRIEAAGL